MSFEKVLERIGEQVDASIDNIKKIVQKEAASFKKNTAKSSDELMKRFVKTAETMQKKAKLNKKGLSPFEEAVGNFAISTAHILEEMYNGTIKKVMATEVELKTKYGKIGSGLGLNLVSKKRANSCKEYLKQAEKKIKKNVTIKKGVLKSIAESSSNNGLELYTYCTYKELAKPKGGFKEQKEVIKKYFLTKEEKRCLKNENER